MAPRAVSPGEKSSSRILATRIYNSLTSIAPTAKCPGHSNHGIDGLHKRLILHPGASQVSPRWLRVQATLAFAAPVSWLRLHAQFAVHGPLHQGTLRPLKRGFFSGTVLEGEIGSRRKYRPAALGIEEVLKIVSTAGAPRRTPRTGLRGQPGHLGCCECVAWEDNFDKKWWNSAVDYGCIALLAVNARTVRCNWFEDGHAAGDSLLIVEEAGKRISSSLKRRLVFLRE